MATKLSMPKSDTFLDPEEFLKRFTELFADMSREFFKLEREQSYVEPNNPSYVAYMAGEYHRAKELLQDGLESSLPFFCT